MAMVSIQSVSEMQAWALSQRAQGVRIALVPTMGYLHAGHLSLIETAKKSADAVVVSIFVNPSQFGPHEDFATYPRAEERDLALCRTAGVSAVFLPENVAMYASDASVFVVEDALSNGLCGALRPGHFRGVCTVVAKLFNIILPHTAVFGQKDYQQAMVIQRMVRDLNFPVKIVVAPTLREADGLAMSSRNVYLKGDERKRALGLSRALALAAERVARGACESAELQRSMLEVLTQHGLKIDYVAIVDPQTLEPTITARSGHVVLIAAYCGSTRLIDNRIL